MTRPQVGRRHKRCEEEDLRLARPGRVARYRSETAVVRGVAMLAWWPAIRSAPPGQTEQFHGAELCRQRQDRQPLRHADPDPGRAACRPPGRPRGRRPRPVHGRRVPDGSGPLRHLLQLLRRSGHRARRRAPRHGDRHHLRHRRHGTRADYRCPVFTAEPSRPDAASGRRRAGPTRRPDAASDLSGPARTRSRRA